jgi:xanthine dehydrogenase accessory factor
MPGRAELEGIARCGGDCVVVTVASTRGSAPREAGARLIVTAQGVHGSIGGGHLEWKAMEIARDLLASGDENAQRRFPLGATLGQCCGGVVNLLFERVAASAIMQYAQAADFHVVLFGAGHVGRALAGILGGLDCSVTWVDSREAEFPAEVPVNVAREATDVPEAEVDAAPAGSHYLVMTHSHALDFELTARILRRGDFAYFGLIGSLTKKRTFERRLLARGFAPESLARITCPIGIPGLGGKQPATIAIAVAAQLLELRERAAERDAAPHAIHTRIRQAL